MDMIIILVGLALLLVLTLKKVPVVYAAAISVIFIALFSRLPVVSTMTGDYMTGFANFVKSSWLMLLLGAILSKVMDITGAARSIASFIIGKLGVKFAIPAIVIAGGLMVVYLPWFHVLPFIQSHLRYSGKLICQENLYLQQLVLVYSHG